MIEGTGRAASFRLACAVTITLLLVLHANAMSLSQMVWACHIASLTLAIGLVLDLPRLIAIGMVFHTGQGIPAWMLDLFVVGDYSITSTLLHTVPLASGAWALWPKRFPHGILIPTYVLHPFAMLVAYLFTDPKLNVMLVHEPYGPFASWFDAVWMSWIANALLSIAFITAGWLVLRFVWQWRHRR